MDPQDSLPDNNAGGESPSQQSSAEQQPEQGQPSQTTEQTEVSDAPSQATQETETQQATEDEELKEWASSQGYSLETENERKLAKRLRDTQHALRNRNQNSQKFTETQEQVAEITDDGEDETKRELRAIKMQQSRRDFWDDHRDDAHLEANMIDYVQDLVKKYKETGDESYKTGALYYSTPAGWADLLAKVKSSSSNDIKGESFEAGRQAERENFAKRAQASAPAAAATSTAAPVDPNSDEAIGKMSLAEYNEWRRSHNPFSAS